MVKGTGDDGPGSVGLGGALLHGELLIDAHNNFASHDEQEHITQALNLHSQHQFMRVQCVHAVSLRHEPRRALCECTTHGHARLTHRILVQSKLEDDL